MRVLHLLASNKFSGAENVACQIIKIFSDEPNFEMAYCSPQGEIKEKLVEEDINYYPLKRLNRKELKRVIKTFAPDIVHAHDMKASFIAALSFNGKIISHIHNSDFQTRKFSIKSVLFNYASRKICKIIWVSDSCFKTYYYSKKVKNKSIILKNSIDIEEIIKKASQDLNEYKYDIVYVGRLANPKNPLRLIEILKEVLKHRHNLKIGIVGSGDLGQATKTKVKENKIDKNIDFLGYKNNPYKILSSSKIMIMTSDREGLPMVALESLALGVPIISTPTDGMCDLIKNGENGYLCATNEEFLKRIIELLDNESLLKKQKDNCELFVKREFSMDTYKKELIKIYND